ncbi:MAG: polyprenyl synthetase family protein [Flavobacteriales bacterium]|nr:polyprenyl synthetase family protein [Flavobacteriia bacterium]NCP04947.1 polyprenyl synthetase family protein [Flavobacteriales bacterium]PIV93461.1 MAG: polyprenyl synthetase [Flavobacteriaceae bacterium CG17_big_fil_post_rev_8_21_14_2_50_33_15]PIY09481.1 MAG: polyprenyl synthetase [Flavobacteriaceae bacterium CG_4_10_14_3_um_filter_33_47]PJB16855.1 MAG: polyprenyl synthetase [Flavobacteriaceae bacterium CG_4_9_14_3_um_filter_33_16]
MLSIDKYQEKFVEYLEQYSIVKEPKNLYEPIQYILKLGGKRLRPVLTLMTSEIFDSDYVKSLNAALSIEVFHNFSLVHDDIMDDAPLRRGKETVHEKWNTNAGILSGDAMLIMAYKLFESYDNQTFRALAELFSKTALEVCEGQQYDVDFETRNDVIITEYLKMIEYKTAVLVGAAMKMGAIVAQASKKDQNSIYEFGKNLGIAFQLQDDYLDAFGDPKTFGKQVGGDIIENKKTILYINALKLSKAEDRNQLQHLFSINPNNPEEKINLAKEIFVESGATKATKDAIKDYTQKAFNVLETLHISEGKKLMLKEFGEQLMNRTI